MYKKRRKTYNCSWKTTLKKHKKTKPQPPVNPRAPYPPAPPLPKPLSFYRPALSCTFNHAESVLSGIPTPFTPARPLSPNPSPFCRPLLPAPSTTLKRAFRNPNLPLPGAPPLPKPLSFLSPAPYCTFNHAEACFPESQPPVPPRAPSPQTPLLFVARS